jgi:hypothetical protein
MSWLSLKTKNVTRFIHFLNIFQYNEYLRVVKHAMFRDQSEEADDFYFICIVQTLSPKT